MDAISADSAWSGMLDALTEVLSAEPDYEGCLDVASAAWLDLPGRCLMSKRQGSVCCLSWNNGEFMISSKVWSPKIFTRVL